MKQPPYTQMTLDWLREINGLTAFKVEYWQPSASVMALGNAAARKDFREVQRVSRTVKNTGVRKDLMGFIDIIALGDGEIFGVQSTSYANISSHRRKINEDCNENARAWLRANGKIVIFGWQKHEAKQRVMRHDGTETGLRQWIPKEVEFVLE